MKQRLCSIGLAAGVLGVVLTAAPAMLPGAEGSFDRTLHVTGPVDLEVTTGSGGIQVRAGDGNQVRVHGRIRNGPNARWMPLTAEQYNVVDEPARLFYLSASMFMIPVQDTIGTSDRRPG